MVYNNVTTDNKGPPLNQPQDERYARLQEKIRPFVKTNDVQAWFEVSITLVCYLGFWTLTYLSLDYSYALSLVFAILAGGFFLRLFSLQHDMGHGRFFSSRRVNNTIGSIFGILTHLPYYQWRRHHNAHHAHVGDLDRRGSGDVKILTIEEYRARPWYGRLLYRMNRNRILAVTIGALVHFSIQQRFSYSAPKQWRTERRGILYTNVALLVLVVVLGSTLGWRELLLTHLPILYIGGTIAAIVLLNQHGFEHTYWERGEKWNSHEAALQGSSYLKVPAPIRWLIGNVGYHHIHHLNAAVPGYNLHACFKAVPELQDVQPTTVGDCLTNLTLALWDEDSRRLISFREAAAQ
jgi:omega-6 fatty acid desaturase (delta-12 desaturase)